MIIVSKRILLRIVSILLMVCFLTVPFASNAGFVDDWLAAKQSTGVSPNYFEGQKRGYFSAGSLAARWPTSNDYLFSVTPLRMKAGCGGIDLFMGGLSFLNFDYLVQKLQNIIQAAPAIAFDIALQVLSEQLRNAGIDMEGIVNALNSLQLDDCKASKALVATIAKPGFDVLGKQLPGEYATAVADFFTSTGVENLYKAVQKGITASGGRNTNTAVLNRATVTESCPREIKDVFGVNGSVIDSLTRKVGNSPYASLMKGVVGDVILQEVDGIVKAYRVTGCTDSKDIKSFIDGKVQARDASGNCVQITDENRNISDWVLRRINSYASKLRSKGVLDSSDNAFLDSISLSVMPIVRAAVATKQESAKLAELSNIAAYAFAYNMAYDFLLKLRHTIDKASELVSKNSDGAGDPAKCNFTLSGIKEAVSILGELREQTDHFVRNLHAEYAAHQGEINALMTFVKGFEEFNSKAARELSLRFGRSIAVRVFTGR